MVSPLANDLVSSIVEVSMNKIALSIPLGVDDWTPERAIIANDKNQYNFDETHLCIIQVMLIST